MILLKNQNNIECCAPIACLHAIEFLTNQAGKHHNLSHLYVYYMARKMQGTLPAQRCQLKSVLSALEKYGACSERLWPFDRNKIDIEPSIDAIFEGVHYKLIEYNVVEDIGNTIFPIIIGFNMGELFLKSPEKYRPVNGTDNKYFSSHAAVIVDATDTGWVIANSFGPKWGNKGYGILPYECIIDIGEAYSVINFAGISSRKKSIIFDK